jgi:methanol metabolism-related c-type cytochrome
MAICMTSALLTGPARADGSGDPTPVSSEDGKYLDKDGNPTFKVDKDGKVDFYSYVGFVRYSANCLRCHGPDGLGSTYGPALVQSLQILSYGDVLATVAGGKKDVSSSQDLVMPALGDNKNVMCYIDAIYVYLRGRSNGAIGRGRPADHEPKPPAFSAAEDECMG